MVLSSQLKFWNDLRKLSNIIRSFCSDWKSISRRQQRICWNTNGCTQRQRSTESGQNETSNQIYSACANICFTFALTSHLHTHWYTNIDTWALFLFCFLIFMLLPKTNKVFFLAQSCCSDNNAHRLKQCL